MKPLHESLALLRRQRHLQQGAVAQMLGIHQSRLSRFENGTAVLPPDTLLRLQQLLGDTTAPDVELPGPTASDVHRYFEPEKPRFASSIPTIPLDARWNQARLTLGPEAVDRTIQDLVDLPNTNQTVSILSTLTLDSALEYYLAARLLTAGFQFVRTVPLFVGLRLAIVHPESVLYTGDIRRWSLYYQAEDLHVVMYPQVTILSGAQRTPRRLDFLGVVQAPTGRLHFDLEVDGPQHQATKDQDARRAQEIGLFSVRLRLEHLQTPNLIPSLLKHLAQHLETRVLPESVA